MKGFLILFILILCDVLLVDYTDFESWDYNTKSSTQTSNINLYEMFSGLIAYELYYLCVSRRDLRT